MHPYELETRQHMSTADAARYLGCCRQTIYRMRRAGELRPAGFLRGAPPRSAPHRGATQRNDFNMITLDINTLRRAQPAATERAIEAHLRAHGALTFPDAYRLYRTNRLSEYIRRIRARLGETAIETRWERTPDGTRYGVYLWRGNANAA